MKSRWLGYPKTVGPASVTVTGARYLLPKGSAFRVDHEFGLWDPALWVADLVAGATRAHQLGDLTHRDMLADRVLEIEVVTGC